MAPWQYVLGALVSLAAAYFALRGVSITAAKAKEGTERTADVSAQQSALEAWQELLQPYRDELRSVRAELDAERAERQAQAKADEQARATAKRKVDEQIAALTERIDLLNLQLSEWKRLARVIARWATTLRDQVLSLGGTVPATPEELLTLQAIEDAEKS